MNGVTVTFSPMTADPAYVRALTGAVLAAQLAFAEAAMLAAWAAQWRFAEQLGHAALTLQMDLLGAAARTAPG